MENREEFQKNIAAILLLLLVTIIFQSKSAHANTILVDGQEFSKAEIIEDFLLVAFSDIPWNADAGEEDRKKIYDGYFPPEPVLWEKFTKLLWRKTTKNYKPNPDGFLSKHRHYVGKGSLYDRNVVNKWQSDTITIGLGVPYGQRPKEKSNEKVLLLIEKQLPDLSKAIGKPIKIIRPHDDWDNINQWAKIRIIPTANMGGRSWEVHHHELLPNAYEESFLNGILFQSYTRRYFDGYLLPVSNHGLDLAICKVNPNLDDLFFAALINECLVRTLGLPAMSKSSKYLLGHWHTDPEYLLRYAAWFKIGNRLADPLADEGRLKSADWYEEKGKKDGDQAKIEGAKRLRDAYHNDERTALNEETLQLFARIPEYDRLMLSLLYCSSIKLGMSKEEVRKVLQSDEFCFNSKRKE